MTVTRALAASVVALTLLAQTAGAQDWQKRRGGPPQPPASQQPPPQAGGGGACVPSGFARLTRNCSVNTGACQRMPENCNRGWCCP